MRSLRWALAIAALIWCSVLAGAPLYAVTEESPAVGASQAAPAYGYDLAPRNALYSTPSASPETTFGVTGLTISTSAEGVSTAPVAWVVAAETEAAAGRLPFHDAALEARVTSTIDDIEAGVTRYLQDGTVFRTSEGLLPKEGAGYYSEYTVENSAYANRGVERIVVGSNGEMYYTPDHYGSFVRIR